MLPKEFENLIDILREYPNVSNKQAMKIIKFIFEEKIDKFENDVNIFIDNLKKIKRCKLCSYFSIDDLCNICNSDDREKKLMIVENVDQIQKYEDWGIFHGKYYLVPILFSKNFERTKDDYNFSSLIEYVDNFNEIIIGLSPTPEGVLTSNLVFDKIKKEKPNILVSKLAIGIPLGTSVDYMDKLTMSYAIQNRKDIK
ncbi:MAG: toprim domain-containing protein [Mycoplasma sp.]|nr:toprim domain-containing protein [Mycoplasma sp.]